LELWNQVNFSDRRIPDAGCIWFPTQISRSLLSSIEPHAKFNLLQSCQINLTIRTWQHLRQRSFPETDILVNPQIYRPNNHLTSMVYEPSVRYGESPNTWPPSSCACCHTSYNFFGGVIMSNPMTYIPLIFVLSPFVVLCFMILFAGKPTK
jgi:hypothetical protein